MRTAALIKRIAQQLLRDKRTLGLLFVAPLLVLSLMYVLFNSNSADPKLGVVGVDPNIAEALAKGGLTVTSYADADTQTLLDEKLDGLLRKTGNGLELTLLNSNPTKSRALQMKATQALSGLAAAIGGGAVPGLKLPALSTTYVYGDSETTFFDVVSPVLVGFFVFFFVFLISGIGLLRERTTGTLERLMSTPIRRSEVITGYLIGYGIFAVIQTCIIVLYATTVLDMTLVGSIWNVLLINLLMALVALSLGILLSTFASSEFQMVQFIPIVVIPQVFFAGIFPVEDMAGWLQAIGRIMPIYYGADALKSVMYKGLGIGDIAWDLLALVLYAAVFVTLNTLALKKYRKL